MFLDVYAFVYMPSFVKDAKVLFSILLIFLLEVLKCVVKANVKESP